MESSLQRNRLAGLKFCFAARASISASPTKGAVLEPIPSYPDTKTKPFALIACEYGPTPLEAVSDTIRSIMTNTARRLLSTHTG